MSDTGEHVELVGPNNGRWFFTQIPDWIALHPDLKDGAFRLYVILRSLVSEKQDEKARILSHDQIAYLAVGKNGKPLSGSAVKGLLKNLHDVGLVDNPDGKRIVTSTGKGGIETRRRYRFVDWPDRASYLGWRNAFDKLSGYSPEWRESRCDVASGTVVGQKSDQRTDQHDGTDSAGQFEGQKSDRPRQKSARRGQKTVRTEAQTSENATSNKSPEEAPTTTSSSQDVADEATPKKKTPKESPEEIVQRRTGCTVDEARAVVDIIEAQGDGNGGRIRSLAWWITRREERTLAGDLAHVRRTRATPTATHCEDHHAEMRPHGCDLCASEIKAGDPEDLARLRAVLSAVGETARPDLVRLLDTPRTRAGSGHQTYRNPIDQDVYDEALL